MANLLGDTGKIADGTLKTFNITYPSAYEKLLGTPISVPNQGTLPGTPIDTYTVTSSVFPTIAPNPISVKYTGMLILSGKNTDSATKTINYQINKNGSNVLAGTFSATNAQYWTDMFFKFMDVAIGDVIDIYLYCSTSALINYDYVAFTIVPTQLFLSKATLIKDASFNVSLNSTLSLGTPNSSFTAPWYVYPSTVVSSTAYSVQMTANVSGLSFNPQVNAYSFGRAQYGDSSGYGNGIYIASNNHATNHPYYVRNYAPTQISFREVLR
jgi:hypothetical protein